MYYDDPYDPTLENDYDEPAYPAMSDNDSITVDSRIRKTRKLIEDAKNEDKGYCKIKRSFKEIEIYSGSDNPGGAIRNAITGVRFPQYRVGTKSEYLFFKVCIATGEKGLRGNRLFFFDSPEQYEKHMLCSVDTKVKGPWHDRNTKELLSRKE
jgi:hypothetical protein